MTSWHALAPVLDAMETVALFSVIALLATFIAYPFCMILLARAWRKPPWHQGRTPAVPEDCSVSVLIGAYNEAAHIGRKIETVIEACEKTGLSYQIFVGDDGSSDDTARIAQKFRDRGVVTVSFPRGGKATTLNQLVPQATGSVLVFTDADPLFEKQTMQELLSPFADGRIGAVAGAVESTKSKRTDGPFGQMDRAYRAYESALRMAEDRVFGCISADGGLLAIRREFMPVIEVDGTDDFLISTAAVMHGKRIAFAPNARVFENPITGNRKTLRRRIRITVRGLTALWHRRSLFNPFRTGAYAFGLLFHKLARRLAPLLIIPIFMHAVVLGLSNHDLAPALVGVVGVGTLLLVLGWYRIESLPKPLQAAFTLGLHIIGLGAGVVLFLIGQRYSQWTPGKTP